MFYLRYHKNASCESRVVDRSELIAQNMVLKKDIAMGKLLRIEESFNSVAGCAVYANMDGIYGEYVSGHIVSLLRRGVCQKRFLIDERNHVVIKEAFQGFEAEQKKGVYIWTPCANRVDKLEEIICFLLRSKIKREKDLLLEILITKDEIVVCDAKYPGMIAVWQGMKDFFDVNCSETYLKKSGDIDSLERKTKIDGFDIDLSTAADDIL